MHVTVLQQNSSYKTDQKTQQSDLDGMVFLHTGLGGGLCITGKLATEIISTSAYAFSKTQIKLTPSLLGDPSITGRDETLLLRIVIYLTAQT